jgi:ribonuclease HII
LAQKAIIRGDEKVFSCFAASIIAKIKRDEIMRRLDKNYPNYNFAKHKGYPTKLHKNCLKKYGLSFFHRKSFTPCKNLLK